MGLKVRILKSPRPSLALAAGAPQVSPAWLMRRSQLGQHEVKCFTSFFYPRLPAAARVRVSQGTLPT